MFVRRITQHVLQNAAYYSIKKPPTNFIHKVPMRMYAIYPPDKFAPAIVNPEKLTEIVETEEILETMKFSPIHPTPNYESMGLFQHPRIIQFQSYVMKGGCRTAARKLMENTFYLIKKHQLKAYHEAKTEEEKMSIELDPLKIFLTAVENCRPKLDLYDVTRGGIKYKVPVPTNVKRSYYMSMKWLVKAGRDRPEMKVKTSENLAKEIIDAFYYKGRVVQKKIDLHKDCEANRAYAHYRWQKN